MVTTSLEGHEELFMTELSQMLHWRKIHLLLEEVCGLPPRRLIHGPRRPVVPMGAEESSAHQGGVHCQSESILSLVQLCDFRANRGLRHEGAPRQQAPTPIARSSASTQSLSCTIYSFLHSPAPWLLDGERPTLGVVMTGAPQPSNCTCRHAVG
jgi:hypothetical protein